jgi:glycosyltransferase involved in cell wall biosynthesis
VLLVADVLEQDGGSRLLLNLGRTLNQLGHPTTVFSLRSRDEATIDAPLLDGHVAFGTERPARLRRAAPTILSRLRAAADAADIIVSGSETGPALQFGWLAGLVARRPVLAMVQTNLEQAFPHLLARDRAFIRHAYPRLDGILCVCEDLIPTVHAVVPRGARETGCAEPGIALEAVSAAARLEPIVPLAAGPTIVAVGRISREKGTDTLIRAHQAVLERGRPHSLLLAGGGAERPGMEDLARSLSVSSSVRFTGHLSNPHAVVARASLLCFASRFEGMPLVLLEALALGVPIVSTNCVAGPSVILRGGRHGDLVPVDSVADLAAAIERHLDQPDRLRRMAEVGREWAAQFTMDRCAEKHLGFYRRILSRRGRSNPRSNQATAGQRTRAVAEQ